MRPLGLRGGVTEVLWCADCSAKVVKVTPWWRRFFFCSGCEWTMLRWSFLRTHHSPPPPTQPHIHWHVHTGSHRDTMALQTCFHDFFSLTNWNAPSIPSLVAWPDRAFLFGSYHPHHIYPRSPKHAQMKGSSERFQDDLFLETWPQRLLSLLSMVIIQKGAPPSPSALCCFWSPLMFSATQTSTFRNKRGVLEPSSSF